MNVQVCFNCLDLETNGTWKQFELKTAQYYINRWINDSPGASRDVYTNGIGDYRKSRDISHPPIHTKFKSREMYNGRFSDVNKRLQNFDKPISAGKLIFFLHF